MFKFSILTLSFFVLFSKKSASQNALIEKYYLLINEAELSIINKQFNKSDSCYFAAFNLNFTPFNKDLLNNIRTSSNFEHLDFTIKKLISRGLSLKVLRDEKNLKKYFDSELGKKLIQSEKKIKKNYNEKLRASVDSLNFLDQKYRKYDDCYVKYKDELRYIDSCNGAWLMNYFNKYGFPSEEELGITEINEISALQILILHHNNGARFRAFNFSKHIWDAIITGKINNKFGLILYLRQGNDDVYGFELSLLIPVLDDKSKTKTAKNSKIYISKISQEDSLMFEQNRKKLFIEPINLYYKKQYAQFMANENNNVVFTYTGVEVFHFNEKSSYNEFIKPLVLFN
jgi:hypothetical protein